MLDDQDDHSDHQSEVEDDEEDTLEDNEDGFNEPSLSANADRDSEPTPHDDSSAVQHKRKYQDLESSREGDDGHAKAQKINNKTGRPRAGDYEDLAKELILQAATVYRCLLSTKDAFPDIATEAEMIKAAWAHVNNETGLTPLRLTPDIVKIVSGHLLQELY